MKTFEPLVRLWKATQVDPCQTLANHQNTAPSGVQWEETRETETYTVCHSVEDGIERIVYRPHQPRFQTPILMQHGMWHGAWCWQPWQELLAEWGWESVATSLPGHGKSPVQRPITDCTLDYYLGFVRDEVQRLPRKPVYFGHSMGGALGQWYFKYVGDDLAAAVLVAPWVSHNAMADGFIRFMRAVPDAFGEAWEKGDSTPLVNTPSRAARVLLSPKALVTPEELCQKLGPESGLVTWQHNPPLWHPAEGVKTPILWVAAEKDAVIGVETARRSAKHYGADFIVVEDAGHNLMMEHNYVQTAQAIHEWLLKRQIV